MKATLPLIFTIICSGANLYGQQNQDSSKWKVENDNYLYFVPNDFFIDPVVSAVHGKMHLEARYNWEARNTFSAWIGKYYSGGKTFQYKISPMAGVVFGQTNGVAPGFEFIINRNRIQLSCSMEYLFNTQKHEDSYFYTWNDLTYSISSWLWVGFSTQRTRVYQTKLVLQKGLILGLGYKHYKLTTYAYNIGLDRPLIVTTLSAVFLNMK